MGEHALNGQTPQDELGGNGIVPPDAVEEWATAYGGQCVLAYGRRLLGRGVTCRQAWRAARREIRRLGLHHRDVVQIFF